MESATADMIFCCPKPGCSHLHPINDELHAQRMGRADDPMNSGCPKPQCFFPVILPTELAIHINCFHPELLCAEHKPKARPDTVDDDRWRYCCMVDGCGMWYKKKEEIREHAGTHPEMNGPSAVDTPAYAKTYPEPGRPIGWVGPYPARPPLEKQRSR